MEITTTTINRNPNRRAAINALAIVGFIALIIMGIAFAIYATRYAPKTTSRISSAAVSLASFFRPAEDTAALLVATSTLPIDEPVISTTTATSSLEVAPTPSRPTTTGGSTQFVTTTVTSPAALYGNPDLTVTITAVGYLRTNDTDSFVESNNVPDNKRGAVKFTVANDGTNVTDSWKFDARIPTSPAFTYTSPKQQSLKPGDRIDYVLGFDRTKSGNNRVITITVDSDRDINESNERNNSDSENVDIRS